MARRLTMTNSEFPKLAAIDIISSAVVRLYALIRGWPQFQLSQTIYILFTIFETENMVLSQDIMGGMRVWFFFLIVNESSVVGYFGH